MGAVVLVRHGKASPDGDDYDVLSPPGREQARAAGRELARRAVPVERLRSGTLRRQADSAAEGVAAWGAAGLDGLAVEVDPGWDEYDHLEAIRCHAPADVMAEAQAGRASLQDVLDASLRAWVAAGGDSPMTVTWPAFRARGQAALEAAADGLGKGRTAVVWTSGGVIAALAATLLDGGPETFVHLNRVSVNSAFTTVLSGRRGLTLSSYNDHAHLLGTKAPPLTYR